MRSYGDPNMEISKGASLLQVINQFSAQYSETIEGKVTDEKSTSLLYGGARINYIFNDIFAKYLTNLTPTDGLTPFDIRTAISNATVCFLIIRNYPTANENYPNANENYPNVKKNYPRMNCLEIIR